MSTSCFWIGLWYQENSLFHDILALSAADPSKKQAKQRCVKTRIDSVNRINEAQNKVQLRLTFKSGQKIR